MCTLNQTSLAQRSRLSGRLTLYFSPLTAAFYQLLMSELDRLGFISQYVTVKIGCLGHYLTESIRALQATTQQSTVVENN